MTFSLNGGWMFAVAVLLWVAVYVPNWGAAKEEKKQHSSFGGKFSKTSSNKSKKTSNGVSDLAIRNKNIRAIRTFFSVLLIASFAVFVIGVVLTINSINWWLMPAGALAVFLLSASTLRSSRQQKQTRIQLTAEQLEAQRARMAYSIREAALRDSKAELLFDERAWSSTELPESNFVRRIGELEEVTLADVSDISSARSSQSDAKLDSDELDRILQRRRAI
jgi:membrane protein implicated in regulation of membrane protease activity